VGYQPKTYRKQGGDELIVASGGTLTIESGGQLAFGTAAVAANDDTLTCTAALHAGRVVQFGKTTGTTVTLPASAGTGNVYRFVIGVTATSNANIIKTAGSDVMDGSLNIQQDTNVDGTYKVWRADPGDDYMSFAGAATTGGIVGGYIECVDYKTGYWSCVAYTQSGGGSEATPFNTTAISPSSSQSPSASTSPSSSASSSRSPSASQSPSASTSPTTSVSPSASSSGV